MGGRCAEAHRSQRGLATISASTPLAVSANALTVSLRRKSRVGTCRAAPESRIFPSGRDGSRPTPIKTALRRRRKPEKEAESVDCGINRKVTAYRSKARASRAIAGAMI